MGAGWRELRLAGMGVEHVRVGRNTLEGAIGEFGRYTLAHRLGPDVLQAALEVALSHGRAGRQCRRCGEDCELGEGSHGPTVSRPRDGEPFDSHRWRVGGTFELPAVRRGQFEEQVLEFSRPRGAPHRPGEFAVPPADSRRSAAKALHQAPRGKQCHPGKGGTGWRWRYRGKGASR